MIKFKSGQRAGIHEEKRDFLVNQKYTLKYRCFLSTFFIMKKLCNIFDVTDDVHCILIRPKGRYLRKKRDLWLIIHIPISLGFFYNENIKRYFYIKDDVF